jgi:hypothetical protein
MRFFLAHPCSLSTTPPEFKDKAKTIAILYVAGQIDYPCWQGWHLVLFPMGLCFLLLYSITLPLYTLWFLRRHRNGIKTDQILRVKDTGHDELSNPRFYRFRRVQQCRIAAHAFCAGCVVCGASGSWFECSAASSCHTLPSSALLLLPLSPCFPCRKAYSKLYQHYRPGKWYWEGAIVGRKVCDFGRMTGRPVCDCGRMTGRPVPVGQDLRGNCIVALMSGRCGGWDSQSETCMGWDNQTTAQWLWHWCSHARAANKQSSSFNLWVLLWRRHPQLSLPVSFHRSSRPLRSCASL